MIQILGANTLNRIIKGVFDW